MINQIEPTYLRYIFDGLAKGAIHPDNASALPDGLIGLYEEAFEENLSAVERHKLLEQFAIWALLKKEVSANFVAEVLGESEEDILNLIATYSKWFNSPESGKFQLYHERLRVFLFQKLSEKEVQILHIKLIERLYKAIKERNADESEYYALQYLSNHLMSEAFVNEDGGELLEFIKSEAIWDRQIQLSNKFDWSKQGLYNSVRFFSKHNNTESISCFFDLLQLNYKEKNETGQILEFVSNGEISIALERIASFGGPTKEEKEKQFILLMLALMEVTFFKNKSTNQNKIAVEEILHCIEQEIPIDHNLINWREFVHPVLIFEIASRIKKYDVNLQILFERADLFETGWILNYRPINSDEIYLILKATSNINDERKLCEERINISKKLFIQGLNEEAKVILLDSVVIARKIQKLGSQSSTLSKIVRELNFQGYHLQAHEISSFITNKFDLSSTLLEIIPHLVNTGNLKLGIESLTKITVLTYLQSAKISIAHCFISMNKKEDALKIIEDVEDKRKLDEFYTKTSVYCLELGDTNDAIIFNNMISDNSAKLKQSLCVFKNIKATKNSSFSDNFLNSILNKIEIEDDVEYKNFACSMISNFFSQENMEDKAFEFIEKINNPFLKSKTLINSCKQNYIHNDKFFQLKKLNNANKVILSITEEELKKDALGNLIEAYYFVGEKSHAEGLIDALSKEEKIEFQIRLSHFLASKKNFGQSLKAINKLDFASIINSISQITEQLIKENKVRELIFFFNFLIRSVKKKNNILNALSKPDQDLANAFMNDNIRKLGQIQNLPDIKNMLEELFQLLSKFNLFAMKPLDASVIFLYSQNYYYIKDLYLKNLANNKKPIELQRNILSYLSNELIVQDRFDEAFELVNIFSIDDPFVKTLILEQSLQNNSIINNYSFFKPLIVKVNQLIEDKNNLEQHTVFLSALVKAYLSEKMLEDSKTYVKEAIFKICDLINKNNELSQKNNSIPFHHQDFLLRSIIEVFISIKEYDEAMAYINNCKNITLKINLMHFLYKSIKRENEKLAEDILFKILGLIEYLINDNNNEEKEKIEICCSLSQEICEREHTANCLIILSKAYALSKTIRFERDRCQSLSRIIGVLWLFGEQELSRKYTEELEELAKNVTDKRRKASCYNGIARELNNIGNQELAMYFLEKIENSDAKEPILMEIGEKMIRQHQLKKGVLLTQSLLIEKNRASVLTSLVEELVKSNKIKHANSALRFINNGDVKSEAIKYIFERLLKEERTDDAFNLIKMELNSFNKNGLIKSMAEFFISKHPLIINEEYYHLLNSEIIKIQPKEASVYFYRSIISKTDFTNAIGLNVNFLLNLLKEDIQSIEHLLQMHALNCLFFQENYPQEKIDKFNKVLNIQWAIDIKNQLPN